MKIILPLAVVSGAGFSWFLLKRLYQQGQEATSSTAAAWFVVGRHRIFSLGVVAGRYCVMTVRTDS